MSTGKSKGVGAEAVWRGVTCPVTAQVKQQAV